MRSRAVAVFLWAFAALGCSDDLETQRHELAHPGGWNPPAELVALADTFDIENVQAGTWIGPEGCGGQFLEGTRVLQEWVDEYWPQVSNIGGYSCRQIANSNSMSVHGTGRALDIHIPIDSAEPRDDSADNDLGDPLANWLLEHAQELGLQVIIWDNMIWSSGRAPGERLYVYTNTHKHHDHLHIELNPDGAALQTPWFSSPMGPPVVGSCGEPIPAEGGVIDDTDDCFIAYGPAEFWRVVEGEGHGGSLRWTNAWQSEEPSNWARWHIELAQAGRYRVEFHNVPQFAAYDSAQYRVRAGGEEVDVHIDLSAADAGWQTIGEFDFAAGADQWVSVYDNAPFDVPADQRVIADAIRLVPASEAGGGTFADDDDTGSSGGPGTGVDPGGREPGTTTSDTTTDPDSVDDVHGKGGCSTTGGASSGAWLLGAALVALRTRRRRL